MESRRLGRKDWLRAARLALREGGPEAVRVEKLAPGLGVTKGSFYWHFKDREELLEALLREWEEETFTLLGDALTAGAPRDAVDSLLEEVQRRIELSEQGESPSDAAIFAWASVSSDVASRVNRVEQQRIEMLTELTGQPDRAELFYYAFLGFIMRRSRVPALTETFPLLAGMLSEILVPAPNQNKSRTDDESTTLPAGRR